MNKNWKAYSKEDEKLMMQLYNARKTHAEIARALGRDVKAVGLKLSRLKRQEKSEGLFVGGVKVADVNPSLIEKSEPKVVETVRDMTPREMIKKLYDLGYRIEDGKLVCYVKQTVKLQDIISGEA